jgi:transposase-like protein
MKLPQKKKYEGKYAPQLKIAIAREYLTSDLGAGRLAVKYNIPQATVRDFIKWYRKKYGDNIECIAEEPVGQSPQPNDAELKITALQMLIENASKELGVDLVKKFGTKQSEK